MVQRKSRPSKIGPINLGTKQTGAPSAGNPHAGCDVAGAGNGFTGWVMRDSQRKKGGTARPDLRNTAPVLDPTGLASFISKRSSPYWHITLTSGKPIPWYQGDISLFCSTWELDIDGDNHCIFSMIATWQAEIRDQICEISL